MSNEAVHPIRVVALRTGLTQETIRIWESRYGVVQSSRTGTGRRLYSDEDIERFGLLRRACLGGRAIGEVAGKSEAELRRLIAEDEASRPGLLGGPTSATMVSEAVDAVRHHDPLRLEATLRMAAIRLPVADLIETVIAPFMRTVGEAWHAGSMSIAQEHLATAMVRAVVSSLTRTAGLPPDAPQIVVATPAGERHEVGALVAAAAAAADGWRVLYLGADAPAADIAHLAHTTRASCVALSITIAEDHALVARELRALRKALPVTRIIVGGQAAGAFTRELAAIDAFLLADTRAMAPSLRELGRGA